MKNLEIGQMVNVNFGKANMVFESEIVDIATNGVWVDHPELRGEDMLYIDLTVPSNSVEAIVEAKREVYKEMEMKEAKKVIQKAFKWEEDDITVSVKVYDCFDSYPEDQQSYDVEIQWVIGDDEYTDCVVVDSYYSNIEGDDVSLKDAVKRAKSVLRTVKGWFNGDDQVTVNNNVEVYHA